MGRKTKLSAQNKFKDQKALTILLARKKYESRYEKFAFIQSVIENKTAPSLTVQDICDSFDAIKNSTSKSGHISKASYFHWLKRGAPKFKNWDEQLARLIKSKQNTERTNGARTIKLLLERDDNLIIGRRVIARYMNNLGIVPIISRTKRGQTKKKLVKVYRVAKNNIYFWSITKTKDDIDKEYCWNTLKVEANTKFDQIVSKIVKEQLKLLPNQIYASDIMFLTEKKNNALQLFAIIDICTKKIINYCYLSFKQNNFPVYTECTRNAVKNKNLLIFQSDNGIEYVDEQFKKIFVNNNVVQSFADKERSWQNGTIEGFFAQLNYRVNLSTMWFKKLEHNEIKNKVDEFIKKYNSLIDFRLSKKQIDPNKVSNDSKYRELIKNNIQTLNVFNKDVLISYRDEYEFKRVVTKWIKKQTPEFLKELLIENNLRHYFETSTVEMVRGLIKKII